MVTHTFSEHFVLFSTYLAPPKILSGTTLQEIKNGTSLITCEVDRGFPLATISWYRVYFNSEKGMREHSPLASTKPTIVNNTRFTIVGSNLSISNVKSSDEGKYHIRVVNKRGQDQLDILAAFGGMCLSIYSNRYALCIVFVVFL